jgi:hypothetical protein
VRWRFERLTRAPETAARQGEAAPVLL